MPTAIRDAKPSGWKFSGAFGWSPPGSQAPVDGWNLDLRSGWHPPGTAAPKDGTQFTPSRPPTERDVEYALFVSPPGTEAPRNLPNFTPKQPGNDQPFISKPGMAAPKGLINITPVPMSPMGGQSTGIGGVGMGGDDRRVGVGDEVGPLPSGDPGAPPIPPGGNVWSSPSVSPDWGEPSDWSVSGKNPWPYTKWDPTPNHMAEPDPNGLKSPPTTDGYVPT